MFKSICKLALLALPFMSMGCADEVVTEPVYASAIPSQLGTGCVIVTDDYGEREVCNTRYYYVNGGVVYWDANFGIWVGPGGYWHGGVWNRGFYPGWHNYYGRGFYRPRGFSGPHGGFHGGGYHGAPHGGHVGGHGGHR